MITDHYFTSGGYFTSHSVFLLYNQSNLSVIGFTQQTDKLDFDEERPGIEQHCHSEPVRRLVWESPSNFVLPIVIQTDLTCRFPEFIQEKWYVYSGDCHASVITGSQ